MKQALMQWAHHNPKPIVLFIDEVDSLVGDTLISLLRQLRAGYNKRPSLFPQSVVLCGLRDVRDYRVHSGREKEKREKWGPY
jgi:ATP-dependent Clp protease ATP-binding subunit ClpA